MNKAYAFEFRVFFWWWKKWQIKNLLVELLDRSLNNFGRRMKIRGWRWWRWFNYLWHGLGLFSAGHRLIQVGDGTTDFDDMRVGGRTRRRGQSLFLRTFFDGIFGHASTAAIHRDHRCWRLARGRWFGGSRRPCWGGDRGSGCSLAQWRRWCLGTEKNDFFVKLKWQTADRNRTTFVSRIIPTKQFLQFFSCNQSTKPHGSIIFSVFLVKSKWSPAEQHITAVFSRTFSTTQFFCSFSRVIKVQNRRILTDKLFFSFLVKSKWLIAEQHIAAVLFWPHNFWRFSREIKVQNRRILTDGLIIFPFFSSNNMVNS